MHGHVYGLFIMQCKYLKGSLMDELQNKSNLECNLETRRLVSDYLEMHRNFFSGGGLQLSCRRGCMQPACNQYWKEISKIYRDG